jgi:hypothetical protein
LVRVQFSFPSLVECSYLLDHDPFALTDRFPPCSSAWASSSSTTPSRGCTSSRSPLPRPPWLPNKMRSEEELDVLECGTFGKDLCKMF